MDYRRELKEISFGDLQMVDGADKMLDMMADNETPVVLIISEKKFDGADNLVLTEKCDPVIGGGNHLMKTFKGQEINKMTWLCQVTEFVFGKISEQIFVRQEKL